MRRDDSVFFFTLVDFLLTALFAGLVLFVVARAKAQREEGVKEASAAALDSIQRRTGISDLAELTDRLSRLGPLGEAEGAVKVVARLGGAEQVERLIAAVETTGGVESAISQVERL